jgi:hypothetical protein
VVSKPDRIVDTKKKYLNVYGHEALDRGQSRRRRSSGSAAERARLRDAGLLCQRTPEGMCC